MYPIRTLYIENNVLYLDSALVLYALDRVPHQQSLLMSAVVSQLIVQMKQESELHTVRSKRQLYFPYTYMASSFTKFAVNMITMHARI